MLANLILFVFPEKTFCKEFQIIWGFSIKLIPLLGCMKVEQFNIIFCFGWICWRKPFLTFGVQIIWLSGERSEIVHINQILLRPQTGLWIIDGDQRTGLVLEGWCTWSAPGGVVHLILILVTHTLLYNSHSLATQRWSHLFVLWLNCCLLAILENFVKYNENHFRWQDPAPSRLCPPSFPPAPSPARLCLRPLSSLPPLPHLPLLALLRKTPKL